MSSPLASDQSRGRIFADASSRNLPANGATEVECARHLTDRIKAGVEAVWQLVIEAYQSRAWAALGYSSWDDYTTREFGTARLRLPREERSEVVGSLRDAGLSIRAIASATGHGDQTIQRDLRERHLYQITTPAPVVEPSGLDEFAVDTATGEVLDDPPLTEAECEALDRKITGTDGKRYQPTRQPSRPRRMKSVYRDPKNFVAVVTHHGHDFSPQFDEIEWGRLSDDDRVVSLAYIDGLLELLRAARKRLGAP